MPGIPAGLQDPDKGVVQDKAGASGKIDAQVQVRLGEHVLRRPHQAQHGRGKQHARNGEDRAEQKPHRDRRMDRALRAFPFPRPDVPCDHDPRADRKAGNEPDLHEHDAAGAADCRERAPAHQVAEDQRIGGIVQLLKEKADGHRNGKLHQMAQDAALGHV